MNQLFPPEDMMTTISKLSLVCLMAALSGCATNNVSQHKTVNLKLNQVGQNVVNGLVSCYGISGRTLDNQDGITKFDWDVEIKTVSGKIPLHIVGQKLSESITDLMVGFKPNIPQSEMYAQWLLRASEKTNKKIICIP